MKKINLFKAAFISIVLAFLLVIAGCTKSSDTVVAAGDTPVPTANVVVQLTDDKSTPYPVDQMTVFILKLDAPVTLLTGATGTDGIARIPVTETGDYEVILVAGVDATNLPEGSEEGREFKKANPIANPYPNLTYTFSGITVSVTALGSDYPVNAPVPPIIKVTVLKVRSVTQDDGSDVTAGTAAFAGRVMLSNFNSNSNRARIRIQSNDGDNNRLMLGLDGSGVPVSGIFRGDSTSFPYFGIGTIGSYTQAGPIYFEAPGTDNGDWALGCNLTTADLHNRGELVSEYGETLNFPQFNGGDGNFVFQWTTVYDFVYSYNYRIFQFDEYLTTGPF